MAAEEGSSTSTTEKVPDGGAPPDPGRSGEAPKAPEAPKEEGSKAKVPAAGEAALDVFDGLPKDQQAKRGAPRAASAAPPGGGGKKGGAKRGKAASPPPAEAVEEARAKATEQAKGVLLVLSGMHRSALRAVWSDALPPEELEPLLEQLEMTKEELDAMADPLGEGMLEMGVSLPWWVLLPLAMVPYGIRSYGVARQMQAAVDAKGPQAQAGPTLSEPERGRYNAETGKFEPEAPRA